MQSPGTPSDEAERLRVLQSYAILDSAPESAYDDLVRLASHLMNVPIALISLVDSRRQWFKARVGLEATETAREISFCAHSVFAREMLVVPDAHIDPRFADNPLVEGDPHIRFYAGAPLRAHDGHVLGTLCVIDHEPRTVDPAKLELLEALARQVMKLLELRRRAAEAERFSTELRDATMVQHRFFELSLDMLCIAGYDGYFKRLNPAWSKALGFSDEELTSRPYMDFVHPDDRETTIREAARLATGHETFSFENRYRTRDGSYVNLLWSASPDPEHQLLMAVARDITPLKEAERHLREAHVAAEAANLAKSEFLANMSHELRTPLNSVIGFTNILLKNKGGTLGARELDYLGRVANNGKHLLRLINDLLDLSKIEAGRLELQCVELDLCAHIDAVVMRLEDQALGARTRLGVTLPAELRPVRSDPDRLDQVLINLIGNALKFAAGGTVEIRVHADDEGRPLRLDVIDDGVGVPPAKQAQVFDSFRQADESTRRRFGGSGLGLTISRALCDMLGYRLEIASEEGHGSLLAVSFTEHTLPLAYVPPEVSPATAADRTEPPPGPTHARQSAESKTVLVIDDDADARAVLENYLQDYGCQIIAADSGARGIELARQLRPDLITLDLMMPHLDGWAVLDALGNDPVMRSIPVIICSIVAGENRASLGGAIAVIDKPVEREGFYAELHHHLSDLSDPSDRSRGCVLVVEPNPERRASLEQWIEAAGAKPCAVASADAAIEQLQAGVPTLAVVAMGEAASLLPRLRSMEATTTMPILLHGSWEPTLEPLPRNALVVDRELLAGDIAELLDRILDLVWPAA